MGSILNLDNDTFAFGLQKNILFSSASEGDRVMLQLPIISRFRFNRYLFTCEMFLRPQLQAIASHYDDIGSLKQIELSEQSSVPCTGCHSGWQLEFSASFCFRLPSSFRKRTSSPLLLGSPVM